MHQEDTMSDTPTLVPEEEVADNSDQVETEEPRIDEHKAQQYLEKLRLEQNLPMAILSGAAGGMAMAL